MAAQKESSFLVARALFIRGLGLIFLIAFVSLWSQLDGLIGSRGILPAKELLDAASRQLGPERFWMIPTLGWINASDAFLHLLCGAGVLCSALLVIGVAPPLMLAFAWGLYLSLVSVSREFTGFQWDNLLLEAGLLAIFFAPPALKPRLIWQNPIPPVMPWMFRWLAFRLIFMSGLVKIASGDTAWRSLTALSFHYETQPLPNPVSWYFHQAPMWFHKLSCAGVFAAELGLPLLFLLGPRRFRLAACAASLAFQGLIILTGNYGFFNLLTVLIVLVMLDDRAFKYTPAPEGVPKKTWASWPVKVFAGFLFLCSLAWMAAMSNLPLAVRQPLVGFIRIIAPLRSVNTYGLFAVMTTTRPEIIIEGSDDGSTWKAYEFKYKPGDLKRPPPFTVPFQPRLDWQMWFAALGTYEQNPWLIQFCVRLLEGSSPVLGLLEKNPFPDRPPKFIRAVVQEYRFTRFSERRATGHWWERTGSRPYCPAFSLRDLQAYLFTPTDRIEQFFFV